MDETRPLRVGFELCTVEGSYGGANPTWPDLLDMAQRAEALGFDSLWVADHLHHSERDLLQHFDAPQSAESAAQSRYDWWEAFTILTAVACHTSRVTLGPLVACTQFRNPALTAKMAETLAEISGGRFVLGLGAGDSLGDMQSYGMPTTNLGSRFEEALTVIVGMLRQGQSDFQGTYHETHNCELRLRGPRPSGPPIMISAKGPRMLRIAAEQADVWNGFVGVSGYSVPILQAMLANLDAACEQARRDPASLPRTIGLVAALPGFSVPGYAPLTGTPEQMADAFRQMAAMGISEVMVWLEPFTPAGLDQFAKTLEYLEQ